MGRSKKLLALGIVCSLLLGGCGNNTQTSTDSSPEPKAATEAASDKIRKKRKPERRRPSGLHGGETTRDQLYYQINDLFMAEHPNVEIITGDPDGTITGPHSQPHLPAEAPLMSYSSNPIRLENTVPRMC